MLCEDQLKDKLVALFSDTKPEYVQDAVEAAQNELSCKAKQKKRADMEWLFDSHIQTLKDRGCPSQIIEALVNGRAKVIDHAQTLNIADCNLPFAPVITPLYLGYHGIVAMVRNGDKSGYTYLDPRQIINEEKVPTGLYYHFDIEDGTSRLGKKPEVSDRDIRSEKRLRSVAAEVVSIGTHTNVLSRHYMDAVGSRYGSVGVPYLCLIGDRPKLGWDCLGDGDDRWGAASCGSRLKL